MQGTFRNLVASGVAGLLLASIGCSGDDGPTGPDGPGPTPIENPLRSGTWHVVTTTTSTSCPSQEPQVVEEWYSECPDDVPGFLPEECEGHFGDGVFDYSCEYEIVIQGCTRRVSFHSQGTYSETSYEAVIEIQQSNTGTCDGLELDSCSAQYTIHGIGAWSSPDVDCSEEEGERSRNGSRFLPRTLDVLRAGLQ